MLWLKTKSKNNITVLAILILELDRSPHKALAMTLNEELLKLRQQVKELEKENHQILEENVSTNLDKINFFLFKYEI